MFNCAGSAMISVLRFLHQALLFPNRPPEGSNKVLVELECVIPRAAVARLVPLFDAPSRCMVAGWLADELFAVFPPSDGASARTFYSKTLPWLIRGIDRLLCGLPDLQSGGGMIPTPRFRGLLTRTSTSHWLCRAALSTVKRVYRTQLRPAAVAEIQAADAMARGVARRFLRNPPQLPVMPPDPRVVPFPRFEGYSLSI